MSTVHAKLSECAICRANGIIARRPRYEHQLAAIGILSCLLAEREVVGSVSLCPPHRAAFEADMAALRTRLEAVS